MQERPIPKSLHVESLVPQAEFVSYNDIIHFIRRYSLTIAASILATLVGVILYISMTQPLYTARTEIIIDPKMPQLLREQTGGISISMDNSQVESQIAVLRSEKIAEAVVGNLKLMDDREFQPSKGGLFRFLMRFIGWPYPVNTAATDLERKRAAIGVFEQGLDVSRVGLSYAIEILFSSNDPDKAARIANAVTEAYVRDQLDSKSQTSRQGSEWLEQRIDQLRQQMNAAAEQVQRYKATHDYRIARTPISRQAELQVPSAPTAGLNNNPVRPNSLTPGVTRHESGLEELESTASTYRRIYESYLQAFTESVQRQSFPVADARVITYATRPLSKSRPKTMLLLAFGVMLGALVGLVASFLRHMQDRSVRLPRHVRDTVSIECLGQVTRFAEPNGLRYAKDVARTFAKHLRSKSIPRTFSPSTTFLDSFDEVSRAPYSAFATSLTAVQTAMRLASRKLPVQCVGITSPFPGDGKTTLSVNLAALFARIGLRVLVVDCDVRKPSLSAKLAPDVDHGLLEVLADSTLSETAKVHAELQSIDLLPLCNVTSAREAFAAIGSENMRKLLVRESESYDIILIDLPALKTDFEALNIIALLDGIVLTVSWGNTSMELLAEVTHMLRTAKAKIMGVVINKVGALSSDAYARQTKSIY